MKKSFYVVALAAFLGASVQIATVHGAAPETLQPTASVVQKPIIGDPIEIPRSALPAAKFASRHPYGSLASFEEYGQPLVEITHNNRNRLYATQGQLKAIAAAKVNPKKDNYVITIVYYPYTPESYQTTIKRTQSMIENGDLVPVAGVANTRPAAVLVDLLMTPSLPDGYYEVAAALINEDFQVLAFGNYKKPQMLLGNKFTAPIARSINEVVEYYVNHPNE